MQVGHMIQAEPDPSKRDEYLRRLMDLPNQVSTNSFQTFQVFSHMLISNNIFVFCTIPSGVLTAMYDYL